MVAFPRSTVDESIDVSVPLRRLLLRAGYDARNEHFAGTPDRWVRAILEFQKPHEALVKEILSVDFEEPYTGMVIIKDIGFTSLCPHHLLPYWGMAHVAYLPSGRVVGISKLARLVEHFTHQIVVQEAATRDIVAAIEEHLKPIGAIALLIGQHTCMSVRGIKATTAKTETADLSGVFKENAHGCRDEFYSRINGR